MSADETGRKSLNGVPEAELVHIDHADLVLEIIRLRDELTRCAGCGMTKSERAADDRWRATCPRHPDE